MVDLRWSMTCIYTHRLRLHRSYWGLRWWFCWTPERYTTGPYSFLCIWTAVGETNGRAAERVSGVGSKRGTGNYILVLRSPVHLPAPILYITPMHFDLDTEICESKRFTSRNWWKTGKRGHVLPSSKASMDLAVSMSNVLWSLSWGRHQSKIKGFVSCSLHHCVVSKSKLENSNQKVCQIKEQVLYIELRFSRSFQWL